VRYQHTDALGSPVAVSDASGTVIERNDYEPYGAIIGKPTYDAMGFTGHKQDGATGLTYMQQRYYDPQLGLFLSVDPVTAYDNPVVHFNRYRYANNNPYSFTDPDGRCGTLIPNNIAVGCISIYLNSGGDGGARGAPTNAQSSQGDAGSQSPSRGKTGAFLGGVVSGAESYVTGAVHSPVHVAERFGLLGEDEQSVALQGESVVIDAVALLFRDVNKAVKSAIDVYQAATPEKKSELRGRVVGRASVGALVSIKYTPFIGVPVTALSSTGTALQAGEQYGDQFRIFESIIYGQVIEP
jgi:RHS repeat-associated protein